MSKSVCFFFRVTHVGEQFETARQSIETYIAVISMEKWDQSRHAVSTFLHKTCKYILLLSSDKIHLFIIWLTRQISIKKGEINLFTVSF